jgi:dihydrofolate synthase/folylpolyglutamate synthase
VAGLLAALGNPQRQLRCVHLAGTNGKGSTAAILAAVLQEQGYRVGTYSSPHLHSYRERIRVGGTPVSAGELLEYLRRVEEAGSAHAATEFEVLTAAALRYLADRAVDIAVVEVGMGGTYDATNLVVPDVAVITSVALDHAAFLGDTLQQVAVNKAGIIKPGAEVVAGAMPAEAAAVVREVCQRQGACLWWAPEVIQVEALSPPGLEGTRVSIRGPQMETGPLHFALPGLYQLENLATAMAVVWRLRCRGWQVSAQAIAHGLGRVRWPGRLEVVRAEPLVVVDAAHNPQGAEALDVSLARMLPGRPRLLVCGVLDDKDAEGILRPLCRDALQVIVTRPEGVRSRQWMRAAQAARAAGVPVEVEEDIRAAVDAALAACPAEGYVVVAGSFYVIDRARAHLLGGGDGLIT